MKGEKMIKISAARDEIAMQVEFSYPSDLSKEDQMIGTELELVSLFEALDKKYGLQNSAEILTNAFEIYLHTHDI